MMAEWMAAEAEKLHDRDGVSGCCISDIIGKPCVAVTGAGPLVLDELVLYVPSSSNSTNA
jgi:hypothetical protein